MSQHEPAPPPVTGDAVVDRALHLLTDVDGPDLDAVIAAANRVESELRARLADVPTE